MADVEQTDHFPDASNPLEVPAVSALKRESTAPGSLREKMERTLSEDIREEREDLKDAAEYTQSVVVELSIDGVIRWISPSWQNVVGTAVDEVLGKPIASLLVSDITAFDKATEAIHKDDARSQNIRFTVLAGPGSTVRRKSRRKDDATKEEQNDSEEFDEEINLDLEGQGIMVYDRTTGEKSHVGLAH
jgi:serine/threonine-protein kinase RIM15